MTTIGTMTKKNTETLRAGAAALEEGCLVKVSSGTVVRTTAKTDVVRGVVATPCNASEPVEVFPLGADGRGKVLTDGSVAEGDLLMPHNTLSGYADTAASGGRAFGFACEDDGSSGDLTVFRFGTNNLVA